MRRLRDMLYSVFSRNGNSTDTSLVATYFILRYKKHQLDLFTA